MENLGIVREVAAVTCGQDVPLFEVREGVFNSDPAARELARLPIKSRFSAFSSAKLQQLNARFGGLDSRSLPKSERPEADLRFYGFRSRGRVLHRA